MSTPAPSANIKTLRPRDAATLVLVSMSGPEPRILMGQRHAAHKFMPNKFVFPGGRVDAADCRIRPLRDLLPPVKKKLISRMRGNPSVARARGLAMAAVRETFEEVGFIVGSATEPARLSRNVSWRSFQQTGHAPDLSGLRLLARAITPPGRTRRFDTRFFVASADVIANPDAPVAPETDELLEPHWVTFEQARALDLPWITGQVINTLEHMLRSPNAIQQQHSALFQYMRGSTWTYETL